MILGHVISLDVTVSLISGISLVSILETAGSSSQLIDHFNQINPLAPELDIYSLAHHLCAM